MKKKPKTDAEKNLPITFRYGTAVYTADPVEFTEWFIAFFEHGDIKPFNYQRVAVLDFEEDIETYDDAEYCLDKCLKMIDDEHPEKKKLKKKIVKLLKERSEF